MKNNKNTQELINECDASDTQFALRATTVSRPSFSLPETIPLPICSFKFCYSKPIENYAEVLVEEVNNGKTTNKRTSY